MQKINSCHFSVHQSLRMALLHPNYTQAACDTSLLPCEHRVFRELLGRTGIAEMKTEFQRMVNNFIAIKNALDIARPEVEEDRDKSECVHSFQAKIGEMNSLEEPHNSTPRNNTPCKSTLP